MNTRNVRSMLAIYWLVAVFILGCSQITQAAQPTVSGRSTVVCADLNGDGVLDLVLGEYERIEFWYGSGFDASSGMPTFTPGGTLAFSSFGYIAPAVCDIDRDGDLDLFFGTEKGFVGFYRNDGSPSSPSWTPVNAGRYGDTYQGIVHDQFAIYAMQFVDIDADGDQDLIVEDYDTQLTCYINQDKETDGWVDGKCGTGPVVLRVSASTPLKSVNGVWSKMHWTDWDGDGDWDVLAGPYYNYIRLFLNQGTPTSPSLPALDTQILQGVVDGTHCSVWAEDFHPEQNGGYLDLLYSSSTGFHFLSGVTNSQQAQDTLAPPSPSLSIAAKEANNATLSWPIPVDSPPNPTAGTTAYRSGLKVITLHRMAGNPQFTPGPSNEVFRYYVRRNRPDTLSANGRFAITDGTFFYQDQGLTPGQTYYYSVGVQDYAGMKSYSDVTAVELAPAVLTALQVTAVPLVAPNVFTVTVTAVDQYGQTKSVTSNQGAANLTFSLDMQTPNNDIYIKDPVTGNRMNGDTWDGIGTRTYQLAVSGPDCLQFAIHATLKDYSSPAAVVTRDAATATLTQDRVPPSVPGALTAPNVGITSLSLSWTAATDSCSGVAGYRLYSRLSGTDAFNDITPTVGLGGVTYALTGLTRNTAYDFKLRAVDRAGNLGPETEIFTVRTRDDTTSPTAPASLLAAYTSDRSQAVLNWSAAWDESGVAKYSIERSIAEYNGFSVIGESTTPSFIDHTQYPGYPFFYRVRAYDNYGNVSGYSNVAQVAVSAGGDTTPPYAPGNLYAQALGSSSIRLTWTAAWDPESAIAYYRIVRTGSGSSSTTTALSYDDTGLTPRTSYSYTVTAVNTAGLESAPVTASASTSSASAKPNPPRDLTVAGRTTNSITLSWTAPLPNSATVVSYRIYRHASATATGILAGYSSTTSYTISGLSVGTSYYFSVRAMGADNAESDSSYVITATTNGLTLNPPTVTRVTPYNNAALIEWTAPTPLPGTTIARYIIGTRSIGWLQVDTTTSTQYRIEGLKPNTVYYYGVRAEDSKGTVSAYALATFTTTNQTDFTPPNTPASLRVLSEGRYAVQLAWEAASDNPGGTGVVGYWLYRDGVRIGNTLITGTLYTDSGLQSGQAYSYQVSAVDRDGNESLKSTMVTGTPGITLYGAHVADIAGDSGWFTRISLVNVGTEATSLQLKAYGPDGVLLETVTVPSLAAGAAWEKDAGELFLADTFTKAGGSVAIRVVSASPIKGAMLFGNRDGQTAAIIPMYDTVGTRILFPYVIKSENFWTGLALQNAGSAAGTIQLKGYSASGDQLAAATTTIPGRGKCVLLLQDMFKDYATPEKLVWVRAESDVALVGFELFGQIKEKGLAGLPVTFVSDADASKGEVSEEPEFAEEAFHSVQLSTPTAPANLKAVVKSPTSVLLSWDPSPDVDIDHFNVYYRSIGSTLLGTTTSSAFLATSLITNNYYTFEVEAVNTGGVKSDKSRISLTLKMPDVPTVYTLTFPELLDATLFDTGVTFTNMGSTKATLTARLKSATGGVLAETSLEVGPRAQATNDVRGMFKLESVPSSAAYVEAVSNQPLMGFELYATRQAEERKVPTQFDGLASCDPAKVLCFPLMRNAPDWLSVLRLINPASGKDAVALTATVTGYTAQASKAVQIRIEPGQKVSQDMATLFGDLAPALTWIKVVADQPLLGDYQSSSADVARIVSYMGIPLQ